MASAGIQVVNIPLSGQLDPGRLPADRPPEAPDRRTSYEQPLCASGVKLARCSGPSPRVRLRLCCIVRPVRIEPASRRRPTGGCWRPAGRDRRRLPAHGGQPQRTVDASRAQLVRAPSDGRTAALEHGVARPHAGSRRRDRSLAEDAQRMARPDARLVARPRARRIEASAAARPADGSCLRFGLSAVTDARGGRIAVR